MGEFLTEISTIVLALAAERPSGPFDMIKLLEKVDVKRWCPISDASVYLAVKKLEARGFLSGVPFREGNMPEKTVYSATEKGMQALKSTLVHSIGATESRGATFDIGIFFICHLPREEALAAVRRRIAGFTAEIAVAEDRHRISREDSRMPFYGRLMIMHNLLVKKAELATAEELLAAVESASAWNLFPALDITF